MVSRAHSTSDESGHELNKRPIGQDGRSDMQGTPQSLLLVADQIGSSQASPVWMDSWQRLGALLARRTADIVPGKYRRLVIAAATPTREYAAVMAALGIVRMSYRDRVLPDPAVQLRRLADLPTGTMVRAVLGGTKVELGPVSGADPKGNLRFGQKTILAARCADIGQLPWAIPTRREIRFEITYDDAFIRTMIPSATPVLFASEARTACAVLGPQKNLNTEMELLVTRPDHAGSLRPVHEVLRPFERYGQQGWHSVISSSQSHDWPDPVVHKRPRVVILDGAAAVQRWIGDTYDVEIVLALVHRGDSSAVSAAETVLNQRGSAVKFDLRELGWSPPSAVEVVGFGDPA